MNTPITTPLPTHLYLIRHGETEWTLTGQHTGRTDLPLTEQGEEEARKLALRIENIPFAHVLTSPLQRARQTCELAKLGNEAKVEPDLAEWDYGDYEGQRSVDIRKERANWNVFQDGCPNGEMPEQVTARADRLIAHLRTLGGNVALFSHGQFGRVIAARWIGLQTIEAQHFLLDTAALSILSHDPHHPEVAVIALWNVTAHEMFTPNAVEVIGVKKQTIERWENEGGELRSQKMTLPLEEK
jgi:broad specificity phosphatase PhoE